MKDVPERKDRTMRKLCLLLCLALALTAGCSGLIASKPMSATIDANAAVAAKQIAQATTQPFTVDEAKAVISTDMLMFTDYRDAAVTGPIGLFEFVFGSKAILANAKYCTLINETLALANTAPSFYNTFGASDYDEVVKWIANRVIAVKNAKDGAE
jgi:hypothetical protein